MMTITGRHTVTMITTTVILQLGKSNTTDLQYLTNGSENLVGAPGAQQGRPWDLFSQALPLDHIMFFVMTLLCYGILVIEGYELNPHEKFEKNP